MADERMTPVFDYDAGEFVVGPGGAVRTVSRVDAAVQVVLKALSTQRGKFSAYADCENLSQNHTYGSRVQDILIRQNLPQSVRLSEIKRAIKETLIHDPWIKDVPVIDLEEKREPNGEIGLFADLTIKTVFDEIRLEEVRLDA